MGRNEEIALAELREYIRRNAVAYARRWAFDRNPLFSDFTGMGGNCTNFVSQCLLAGGCQMNFTPTFGWYFLSSADRAPAWTGVEFLYNFLTNNALEGIGEGLGPFGTEVDERSLLPGDVIQLGREQGDFYHTLLVTGYSRRGYLVAAQSDNAFNRPLSTYNYRRIRYIHIDGFRVDEGFVGACYDELVNGVSLGF